MQEKESTPFPFNPDSTRAVSLGELSESLTSGQDEMICGHAALRGQVRRGSPVPC